MSVPALAWPLIPPSAFRDSVISPGMLTLQAMGHDPAVLRGGMGARTRAAALSRLQFQPGGPPLLVVATGP